MSRMEKSSTLGTENSTVHGVALIDVGKRAVRAHQIADARYLTAGKTGKRSFYPAVPESYPGLVDGGLRRIPSAQCALPCGIGAVALLTTYGVRSIELLHAIVFLARVFQRTHGLGKLTFRLAERSLKRRFVYLEKHGSLLHVRAFTEKSFLKNARHLRLHRGGAAALCLPHERGVKGHVHAFEFYGLYEGRRQARPGGLFFVVLIAGDQQQTQQRESTCTQRIHDPSSMAERLRSVATGPLFFTETGPAQKRRPHRRPAH